MTEATDQTFIIKEKLANLEQSLLDGTPNMPVLLRDIHRELKADPDTVTLLTEEECATLVKGLKKQTSTEIATKAVKSTKKAASKITVDDL